ncbi:MAG: 4-hydroxy-tetrahydrodipicolinate synthase [Ramlibacter sp.]
MRPALPFGRVMSAMVTPFDAAGRLDLDAARALARHLVAIGNEGLVVGGTTGESTTLADGELADLVRAVSEAVAVPVIAGTGDADTAHSVERTRQARGWGAAGVLAVAPYYSRPPQAGIEAHFRAIAAASDLPVMLYDVPRRTGRRVAHEVLLRLFREVPNLVAFKDATGDIPAAAALVAEAGAHFALYSGDDAATLPLLAVGAVGVVGTTTHWTAPWFTRLLETVDRGDLAAARAVHAHLLPSFRFVDGDDCVFAMAVKAMLAATGHPVGNCRLPLPPAPPGTRERALAVWQALND